MMQMTQFIINMIESRVVISGKDPPYPQFIANVSLPTVSSVAVSSLMATFESTSSRRSLGKTRFA